MACIIFGGTQRSKIGNYCPLPLFRKGEGWGPGGAMFCTLSYFWDNCADNTSIYSKLNFSSPPAG